MIVCSCNVLTAEQVLATLEAEAENRPRNATQAYHCLGCAPQCGRCLVNVQAMLAQAQIACKVGCAICPGHDHAHEHEHVHVHEQPQRHAFPLAAE